MPKVISRKSSQSNQSLPDSMADAIKAHLENLPPGVLENLLKGLLKNKRNQKPEGESDSSDEETSGRNKTSEIKNRASVSAADAAEAAKNVIKSNQKSSVQRAGSSSAANTNAKEKSEEMGKTKRHAGIGDILAKITLSSFPLLKKVVDKLSKKNKTEEDMKDLDLIRDKLNRKEPDKNRGKKTLNAAINDGNKREKNMEGGEVEESGGVNYDRREISKFVKVNYS